MGMAAPDVILFAVGLVLFSGAAYAIVELEGGVDALGGGGSSAGLFRVQFPTSEEAVGESPVASFATATATFDVAATNVTQVFVTVQCTDPASAAVPFTLRVEVTGPRGLASEPVEGACGQALEVTVPVASPPATTQARGATEAAARADLDESANATLAQGTWTVTVSGSRGSAPGLPVNPTNPGGTIALSVERWGAQFSPIQG